MARRRMFRGVTTIDSIDPALGKITDGLENMTPAMSRIESSVFKPLAISSWASSGITSRTGELKQAITPWSGKRSAGVSLRTRKGRDLVLPKAHTFMKGCKGREFKRKDEYKVTRNSKIFMRKNLGSPWGAIKKRRFFPTKSLLISQMDRIEQIISRYLQTRTR